MAAVRALYLRNNVSGQPERIRRLADHSNPLETFSDEEIRQKFRFRPDGIVFIVDLVNNRIRRATNQNDALPPLIQVLLCLRFLASGSFFSVVADGLPRVSKSTVCRAVWDVINALLTHFNAFVRFPSDERVPVVKQGFYAIAGFPNVIGLIDGTQIPIQAPHLHENDFVCRKGFHSINCQMICDPDMRFINVVAKWPGSVHDSRILRESNIGRELQQGVHKGMLLGDSGYPCRRYLMTPYLNPMTPQQINFNRSLCRTRVVEEQAFGVLKRKFACLNKLRVVPIKVCKVVCATVMLHNIAINMRDIDDEGELPTPVDDNIVYGGDDRQEGQNFRNRIATEYF